MKLVGYTDRISVAPGERIEAKVSADGLTSYRARVIRLIHGDVNPAGPGFRCEPVADLGSFPGRLQTIQAGSCALVPDHPVLALNGSFTLAAFIWPTTPAKGDQSIIAKGACGAGIGVCLGIGADGALTMWLGDGQGGGAKVTTAKPLLSRHWYFVAGSYDAATGTLHVVQRPLTRYPLTDDAGEVTTFARLTLPHDPGPLVFAAWQVEGDRYGGHYNGKIEAPCVLTRAAAPAELDALAGGWLPADAVWDFAREMTGATIVDIGPLGLNGRLVNLPARAMKGRRWTGRHQSWVAAPQDYGAIHFHDDDLADAGWATDFAWEVPAGQRSGVYCLHLQSEDGAHEDMLPFAVRPPRGRATADVAVLLPTASYTAYANHHGGLDAEGAEMMMGRLIVLQPADLFIDRHREYGLALYDTHSDGSGVCYSSRLRPVLNMRPKFTSWLGGAGSGLWQFNADTQLIDWLEAKGVAYDVVTDEDLEAEGAALLEPYRVVLTGTHPEYHSTRMWDAMKAWQDQGGRLMYLGGNGWYWRIAFSPELPGTIEVRRAEDGIRTWEAEPGEYFHSFNGEFGGLWRRVGRPPNLICGVGFTAQGFDLSSYYVRKPDSFDARAVFIFDGIGADERIGDFGLVGGGAAGLELDRAEKLLGTPPHALVLASSVDHTDLMLLVNEEFTVTPANIAGNSNPKIRADLVFYETLAGGAVFSTGSIAWCGSLSHHGYDNNVSRIMHNVLTRFRDPTPFAV